MLIFFYIECVFWPKSMVGEHHFRNFFPFLRPFIVLDVRVLIDVLVGDHDVKALIHDLPVPGSIDKISHFIPRKRMSVPELDNTGGFLLLEVRANLV